MAARKKVRKKQTKPKTRARKKKTAAKSTAAKRKTSKKSVKTTGRKTKKASKRQVRKRSQTGGAAFSGGRQARPSSGQQSGDLQGLSRAAGADSESVDELLEKYAEHGDAQFTLPDVLRVPPISRHGTVADIVDLFGGPDQLRSAVNELQATLYAS